MRRAVLDTSIFVARETRRPLAAFPKGRALAVSMVTVAELEMGVLAARDRSSRTTRLRTLWTAEATDPLPITRSVAARFAEIVITRREQGKPKLETQDAWIAATALDHDAELWTQDSDFDGIPELAIVRL